MAATGSDNNMPIKRPTLSHGRQQWLVDYGLDDMGKRQRRFFETQKEADDAIDIYERELKKLGEYWLRLSPAKRRLVVGILTDMETKGRSLDGVWADWQRWQKDNAQTVTVPMPYEDVVTEWKRRKLAAGKTERYVYHAGADLMKFGKGRERQNIHEILPNALEAYIDAQRVEKGKRAGQKWDLSTKRTNMSLFSGLWKCAIAKGWASINIVDRLEPVGKPGRVVKIYDNATTLNLMAAVMTDEAHQVILGTMTLGFFGCMRPEEVLSKKPISQGLPSEKYFGWHDIDLEHGLVTVRVEVAKTGDQRVIRLQPCAVKWLKLAKELKCVFPPPNEMKLRIACWKMIGLQEWIRDGMRKSCATHLRAVYKNDYDVVKDCGNSIRVLLKHYADLHTPEVVSLEHWMITPEKVKVYLKTKTWETVLRTASTKAANAIEASSEPPKP
jgi:hypothetical protein